jgi:hypothetical protein
MAIMKGLSMSVNSPAPSGMKMTALPLADLAALITRVGGRPVTAEMLQADINAGAPVNPDGTMNLVHYAAWVVREVTRRGD